MDVEARRKYCGLLMFDSVPTKSSGREVDPSSDNGTFSFVDADDNCLCALAAGAAAGDDDEVQETGTKQQQTKRTPRPPNAFILYRREKQPAIIAANRHLSNAQVSRQISEMWRNESKETRLWWERCADRKKLEHMKAFPDYVYRPNKTKSKNEKMDKRRQQRRRESDNVANDAQQEPASTVGPIRHRPRPTGRPTVQIAEKVFPQIASSQPNTEQQMAYMMSASEMLFDEDSLPTAFSAATAISQKMRHPLLQTDVVPTEDDVYQRDFPQNHQQQQFNDLRFYEQPLDNFWPVPDMVSSPRQILDQAMLYHTPHEHAQSTPHVVSSPDSTSTVGSNDGSPTIPSQPDTIMNPPAIYGDSFDHFVGGNEHQFAHLLAGYGLNEYWDGASGNHHDTQSV